MGYDIFRVGDRGVWFGVREIWELWGRNESKLFERISKVIFFFNILNYDGKFI